jgi:alkylhydroperoxidase family enzyme
MVGAVGKRHFRKRLERERSSYQFLESCVERYSGPLDSTARRSGWPVAFHTALGLKQGIDPADIQAIRERQLPKQKRYAALSGLAKKLIEKRGQLTNDDRTAFLEAGFEEEHLLEVVAVIAASTITNYAGKITNRPLEALLQEHAWRG